LGYLVIINDLEMDNKQMSDEQSCKSFKAMIAEADRLVVDRKAAQVSNYIRKLYMDKKDSQATSFMLLWLVWRNLTIRIQDMLAEDNGIAIAIDAVLKERGKRLVSTEIAELPKH